MEQGEAWAGSAPVRRGPPRRGSLKHRNASQTVSGLHGISPWRQCQPCATLEAACLHLTAGLPEGEGEQG